MWKSSPRLLLLLGFLSIFCLRYLSFYFAIPFIIGGLMGFYFSFVEGLVQLFLSQDERQEQANLFKYLKLGKMGEVFSLVQRRVPKQSMIRSWLFVLIYIVMGLFVMTSTRSFVGEGLVLGIGLRYLIDFWQYRKKYSQLIQIYGPIDDDILTKIPLIFSIIFVIFSLIGLQLL